MKKMLVVTPDVLTRQTQVFEAPEKIKTLSLDEKMREILDRGDITDEEKVKLYENALNLYTVYRRKAIGSSAPSQPPVPALHHVDDVVASVPKALRGKAEQLARTVLREMKWSPRGELIVEGQVVPGSHIVDLVNDAMRFRKTFSPIGRNAFIEGLAQTNVPQELVGNREMWERLRRFNQTGKVEKEEEEEIPASRKNEEEEDETPMNLPRSSLINRSRRRDQYAKAARWLHYT